VSIRRIVLGIDGSPATLEAVAWTADLAARLGVPVVAVHAFNPLDHLDEISPGVDFGAVRDSLMDTEMPIWTAALTSADVDVTVLVVDDAPAAAILGAAAHTGADLIVLGARRLGLVKRVALGSTSQQVLKDATVPVVVIHPTDQG